MDKNFSVLMSVYKNDKPEQIKLAIESIYEKQTLKPNEIILVVDGPVSDEIMEVLKQKEKDIKVLKLIIQEENQGLGKTLNNGLSHCSNELVARMDADDISVSERFEKQIEKITSGDYDIVGSNIAEFDENPDEIVAYRVLPTEDAELKKFMQSRSPFSHATVVFKKSMVEKAGGYQHLHYCEDYYLWVRMALAGAKMANINESLVTVRMNKDTYQRRSGYAYYKSHKTLFKFMRKNKMIGFFKYLKNLAIRFTAEVLISNKTREKLYKKHLRSQNGNNSNNKTE